MKRSALVIEHDIVGTGYAHDKCHPGGAQQRHQIIHIILIGFSMIGITNIAT